MSNLPPNKDPTRPQQLPHSEGETLQPRAIRRAARLVLLDPQNRVLLINIEDDQVRESPSIQKKHPFWITPGGGIKGGESEHAALVRELFEETGKTEQDVEIGNCLWRGEHVLNWGGTLTRCFESFFLARAQNADVSLANMEKEERLVYRTHKWWTLEELRNSREIFLPKGFVTLLKDVLNGNIPSEAKQIDLTNPPELTL